MTENASSSPLARQPLLFRLRRLWPYFRGAQGGIGLAFLGALVAAATEPAIPALLKLLLDEGFVADAFPIWLVPVALMGLFVIRGVATFVAKYALNYTAAGGMVEAMDTQIGRVLREFLADEPEDENAPTIPEKLSKRQKQLLVMLDRGLSNRDIAEQLQISEHTVKVHLWRLFRRLNVKSRSQASHLARTAGLLDM